MCNNTEELKIDVLQDKESIKERAFNAYKMDKNIKNSSFFQPSRALDHPINNPFHFPAQKLLSDLGLY